MKILLYTLRSVAYTIIEPSWIIMLIIMAIVLYRQNKKTTVMQRMIIGENLNSPLELTISQVVLGILAGTLGSIILSYLGVIFDENSLIFVIFIISIALMFINPRFICFAYSGAILGASSLVLSQISAMNNGTGINILGENIQNLDFLKIDIVALMTLVAVLHFVEGILVIIDGKTGALPVFTNRDNKVIGGFALKRYWALPIALFIMFNDPSLAASGEQVAMPDWWPIVKTAISSDILKDAVIGLTAFYGVIGYSSVTFTKDKTEKTLISGVLIIMYSLALFGVAQLARYGLAFKVLALVFAPVAHEGMLNIQKYIEMSGEPKYVSGDNGVMVLEVAPNSPAYEMGIKTGDVLVEINNKRILSEEDIFSGINEAASFIWFKIKRRGNKLKELSYNKMNSDKKLGIVFVPRNVPSDSVVVKLNDTKFKDVLDKIKDKDKEE